MIHPHSGATAHAVTRSTRSPESLAAIVRASALVFASLMSQKMEQASHDRARQREAERDTELRRHEIVNHSLIFICCEPGAHAQRCGRRLRVQVPNTSQGSSRAHRSVIHRNGDLCQSRTCARYPRTVTRPLSPDPSCGCVRSGRIRSVGIAARITLQSYIYVCADPLTNHTALCPLRAPHTKGRALTTEPVRAEHATHHCPKKR